MKGPLHCLSWVKHLTPLIGLSPATASTSRWQSWGLKRLCTLHSALCGPWPLLFALRGLGNANQLIISPVPLPVHSWRPSACSAPFQTRHHIIPFSAPRVAASLSSESKRRMGRRRTLHSISWATAYKRFASFSLYSAPPSQDTQEKEHVATLFQRRMQSWDLLLSGGASGYGGWQTEIVADFLASIAAQTKSWRKTVGGRN